MPDIITQEEFISKCAKFFKAKQRLPNLDEYKEVFGITWPTLKKHHSIDKSDIPELINKKFKNLIPDTYCVITNSIRPDMERVLKLLCNFFEKNSRLPLNKEVRRELGIATSTYEREFGTGENRINKINNFAGRKLIPDNYCWKRNAIFKTKEEFLLDLAKLRQDQGRLIKTKELRQHYKEMYNDFRRHYGDLLVAEADSRSMYPEYYGDLLVSQLLTPQRKKNLEDAVKKYNKFIITTAVSGCDVDKNLLKNLQKLAEDQNACILVMICSDPARDRDTARGLGSIDICLDSEIIVVDDISLNNNLHLDTLKMTAKQINPLTGLKRINKAKGSIIYASPKFFLEYRSTHNNKVNYPHANMTTGAITVADYHTDMYMSLRTGKIAEHDHKKGAIFVEIEDKKIFHFTQIEIKSKDSHFYFRNKKYSVDLKKPQKIRAEAFFKGDTHQDITSPAVRKAWTEVVDLVKPKRILFNDILNGSSVNHWIRNSITKRAKMFKEGKSNLRKELEGVVKELKYWSKKCDELIIVPSNHDDWLTRWLETAEYARDYENHYIGVCLAKAYFEGHYPLQFAIEEILGFKSPKLKFLGLNDDLYIGNVQVNCHGHKGVNGSKGSIQNMENAYVESVSGDSHTAGILREAWKVGTSTDLDAGYNEGPSTWTQTSCIIYKNGERALVNAVNGKWKT